MVPAIWQRHTYTLREVLAEYEDLRSDAICEFIYGPGIDKPVCMITYSPDGGEAVRYFYHA